MGLLIWGGLNPLGTHIISYFLQEGIETLAVKSNMRSDSEEEHEMYFGRNALFQAIEAEDRATTHCEASTVCFLGPFFKQSGHPCEAIDILDRLLNQESALKTIILISGSPKFKSNQDELSIDRLVLGDLEKAFLKRVKYKNEKKPHVQLSILYTIYDVVDEAPYSRDDKDRREFAKIVYELTQLNHLAGIHIYQFKKNNEASEDATIEKNNHVNFKLERLND